MSDYLVRATAGDGKIRAIAATTTALVEEARRRHDCWPTATAALGRALTAVALLAATMKEEESVILRLAGDGPLGGITAEADSAGRVRGYVKQPHVHLPLNDNGKLDVAGAVGRGFVHLTRDMGLRDMYTGTSEIVSGEIAEDITHYLAKSEQTASAVALGVLVDRDGSVRAAGGYLLQVLPGATAAAGEQLERNLQMLGAVTRAVDQGLDADGLLTAVLVGMEHHVLARQDLVFHCRCSQERAREILFSLGQEQVAEILAEDRGAELTCQFCGGVYHLSEGDLRAVLERLAHPEP